MSISNYAENKLLDTLRNQSFAVSTVYVALHLGNPGEDGSMSSSATLEWTNVAATETYTHWSAWDNATAGNCLWYGDLSAPAAVTAGDTFQITSLTLSLD
jgi:hypothetical protein